MKKYILSRMSALNLSMVAQHGSQENTQPLNFYLDSFIPNKHPATRKFRNVPKGKKKSRLTARRSPFRIKSMKKQYKLQASYGPGVVRYISNNERVVGYDYQIRKKNGTWITHSTFERPTPYVPDNKPWVKVSQSSGRRHTIKRSSH